MLDLDVEVKKKKKKKEKKKKVLHLTFTSTFTCTFFLGLNESGWNLVFLGFPGRHPLFFPSFCTFAVQTHWQENQPPLLSSLLFSSFLLLLWVVSVTHAQFSSLLSSFLSLHLSFNSLQLSTWLLFGLCTPTTTGITVETLPTQVLPLIYYCFYFV